jgi:hypothetical protein
MLRLLAVLLLAANGLFFAWSQGWLDGISGVPAHGEREPDRLSRQVNPDAVKLLPSPAASAAMAAVTAASAPSAGPPACLEAGPFSDAELSGFERALGALPPGSWTRVTTQRPGRWLVYMGRFGEREQLERRMEELRRRQIDFSMVQGAPAHEPGLSLGSYDTRAAAEAALERFAERGVRTARVLALPAAPATLLRAEKPDAALRTQLAALGFTPCGGRP